MGRTIPTYCEHNVAVDGGDFVETQRCRDCEAEEVRRLREEACPVCGRRPNQRMREHAAKLRERAG